MPQVQIRLSDRALSALAGLAESCSTTITREATLALDRALGVGLDDTRAERHAEEVAGLRHELGNARQVALLATELLAPLSTEVDALRGRLRALELALLRRGPAQECGFCHRERALRGQCAGCSTEGCADCLHWCEVEDGSAHGSTRELLCESCAASDDYADRVLAFGDGPLDEVSCIECEEPVALSEIDDGGHCDECTDVVSPWDIRDALDARARKIRGGK